MGDKHESTDTEQRHFDQSAEQAQEAGEAQDAREAQQANETERSERSGQVEPESNQETADAGPDGELEREVEKLREALLRTRADMENMQKRAERDMERARRYQHEALMRDLLPVVDGLEQGLENAADGDSAREGLELTRKLLLKALEDHGLETINPEGERFDPQWHEAMSVQPSEEAEPDTVLMVLQKGYRLNDRLLRAARVIVASAP